MKPVWEKWSSLKRDHSTAQIHLESEEGLAVPVGCDPMRPAPYSARSNLPWLRP